MKRIWKNDISVDILNTHHTGCLTGHLGIEFTEVGDDFVKATMPVDERTRQPLGLLNGGASCALAESIASRAANYCVNQDTHYCVGLDINANHVRGISSGFVEAIALPLHLGRTTQVWEIKINNNENKLLCIARLTCAVVARS
jgi:1,4-dihydroxy-2-naphthoyl-CoA hydrolase